MAIRIETGPGDVAEVTLIVDIARKQEDERDESRLVESFVDNFRRNLWPGERFPMIYFRRTQRTVVGRDPRLLVYAREVHRGRRRAGGAR